MLYFTAIAMLLSSLALGRFSCSEVYWISVGDTCMRGEDGQSKIFLHSSTNKTSIQP